MPIKGYYDLWQDSDDTDTKTVSQTQQKGEVTDIGLGKVRMNSYEDRQTGNDDGDEAMAEFSLVAGSHINLYLWQFIVWQLVFVIVGICICGCSIGIYNKCCS